MKRDELKRKRGALQLNSDLEVANISQEPQAELPIGIGGKRIKNLRSKLQNNIRKQEKEAKEQQSKEKLEKQERHERVRNYSKNVKEIFKPNSSKDTNMSLKKNQLSDYESLPGANAEERKSFLVDPDTGVNKEIKQRLRSGYSENRDTKSVNAQEIAEQHSKRLKVAKSSRISLGAPEAMKPPRMQRKEED